MGSNLLVIAPIAVLLLGALLQGLFARLLTSRGKGWMAFGASILSIVGVLALWPATLHGQAIDLTLSAWDGPIALAFRVDGVSQIFALMGAFIGAAVLLYSVDYMSEDRSATRFYTIMQVFIAGLIAFVYARDLLLMYAGWEIIGLCSFLLVSFWYTDPQAAAGARKVLVMTHIAGYALLAAILVIFARTGTTLWTDPRVGQAFTSGVFALMLIAAIAKSVQFPLHTWIPSAMAAPTPVSALLHAACYVKAGVYLVTRMHSFVVWPAAWQASVVWVGTATMLVGVLFAMIQHDAKRLLAFHTVSQIGYMMVGLGLGTPLGIAAGLLHCFNHGLFKGGLFLGAGAIQHATGTRDMDKLGGLARRMPTTTVLWLVSAASIAGVPLFNGFVSKWLLYVAAMQAGFTVPALVAWIVSALTMFSFMKASSGMFFGADGEASSKAHESPRLMLIGSGVLAAGCIVLGLAPQLGFRYLIDPALAALGLTSGLSVTWFGLTAAGGASWLSSAGLLLAIVSLLLGGLGYWLAARRRGGIVIAPVLVGGPSLAAAGGPSVTGLKSLHLASMDAVSSSPFSGGAPLKAGGHVKASDFSASVRLGLAPFYKWFDVDRYYLALWHWTQRVFSAVAKAGDVLERNAVVAVTSIGIAIGVATGLAAGVVRHEQAAEALVGAWPVAGAIALALCALMLAASASVQLRKHIWLVGLSGVLVLAALFVEQELIRVIALEAGALAAFAALVAYGVERQARRAYLAAVIFSAVALIGGTLMLDSAPAGLVLGCIVAGFAVKLALMPAYLWLPAVAERTPAPIIGLIISVVDVAAFVELIGIRQSAPWLFQPMWPWIALAVLSAVVGAGLALVQQDIKRFLAFSTITDAGFILIGVTVGGAHGLLGAAIGVSVHALAKALLFSCVSAAEADGPVTLKRRGMAVRHPLAAAGFVAGSLAALGVPPTVGYAGHWRLYASALSVSPLLLACLIVATALSVLAYARFIALVWWGRDESDAACSGGNEPPIWRSVWTSESLALVVPIVVLTVTVLAVGLWPRIL